MQKLRRQILNLKDELKIKHILHKINSIRTTKEREKNCKKEAFKIQ